MTSMKTSINNLFSAHFIGNGHLLLIGGADGVLRVSQYGEASLTLCPVTGGAYVTSRRDGNTVCFCYYGLPPSPDPTLCRSAVTVTISCHPYKPRLTLDVTASHDLTLSLSSPEGLLFGRRGEGFFRTAFGLQGIPEGCAALNEDEGTLTFLAGYSRLLLCSADCSAEHPRSRDRTAFLRRFSRTSAMSEEAHTAWCETLYAGQSLQGGFCLGDAYSSLAEQCDVVAALASAGNRLSCDAFFSYVISLLNTHGRLPYAATADGRACLPSRSDGEGELALLRTLEVYVRRFGLAESDGLLSLAGRMAEALLAVYRGRPLPTRIREALAFSLSICREGTSRGCRFRIASALDYDAMTERARSSPLC